MPQATERGREEPKSTNGTGEGEREPDYNRKGSRIQYCESSWVTTCVQVTGCP